MQGMGSVVLASCICLATQSIHRNPRLFSGPILPSHPLTPAEGVEVPGSAGWGGFGRLWTSRAHTTPLRLLFPPYLCLTHTPGRQWAV